jgi:hypothetical protein
MRVHGCVRLSLALFLLTVPLLAQNEKDTLDATIGHEDALFWEAYNRCDVTEMSQFFWPDFESYHDKGGLTIRLDAFVETLKMAFAGSRISACAGNPLQAR